MERDRPMGMPRPRARVGVVAPGLARSATLTPAYDRVRWGPIWAGLVTAVSSFVLLQLLLAALGVLAINWDVANWSQIAPAQGWITAALGLLAFFLGGLVTGSSSLVRGSGAGALNGFLVWASALVLILILSAMGLGYVFGAAGEAFARFALLGRGTPDMSGMDLGQMGVYMRQATMWAAVFLLLSAGAAAAGGAVGDQGEPIGEVAAEGEAPPA